MRRGGMASGMGHFSSPQSHATVFIKAHCEYLRKNYQKAIKLLASCPPLEVPARACCNAGNAAQASQSEAELSAHYFNNMACILFRVGPVRGGAHAHAAGRFASLRWPRRICRTPWPPMTRTRRRVWHVAGSTLFSPQAVGIAQMHHGDKRFEIMYNCGLVFLHGSKPLFAHKVPPLMAHHTPQCSNSTFCRPATHFTQIRGCGSGWPSAV